MSDLESLIREWEGSAVIVRHDPPTGSWIFVALHDTTLGPALGGCRMRVYPTPAEGLRDAMRLAQGMTHKWAVVDYPYGGGKAVLAVPRPLEGAEREGLLLRFGALLESLRGCFATGEDLGTTPEDMVVIGRATRFVHGVLRDGGETLDPGPYTALGVFAGIRAALPFVFPDASLEGRRVLVQGVGDVGGPLARLLAGAGAEVIVSDPDEGRVEAVRRATGAAAVPPGEALRTGCDVLAPCALGAVLDRETVGALRCRIVAGSANNQLSEEGVADELRARGILYAPDYVVNAGGAIALPMLHRGASEAEARERVERIGATLGEILAEAEERSESPLRAARRRVRRILEAKRAAPA